MNESKGIPASLDAHCWMMIGFDLEDRLAASTSTKVARHQTKRERVLRNMLIALILSIQRGLQRRFIELVGNGSYGRGSIGQSIDHVPKHFLHHLTSRADSRSAHRCGGWLGFIVGRAGYM
jgi:hypothetical protein